VASAFSGLWSGGQDLGSLPMSRAVKDTVRGWASPLASTLASLGIRANTLTVVGLLLNILAAMMLAAGHFTTGGLVFLVFNALDFLDGAVARLTGTASDFGAFLDSVVDRYSEAVIFLGLGWWYVVDANPAGAMVTSAALVGSLMVSYTRARAEGLGYACEVGLLPRPERTVLLGLGMIASGLLDAPRLFFFILIALAALTNLTALQRILHMQREVGQRRG
jgi:CDP-diacylglycerol--glycerol-3-phosphate 3-phosphatidyltransferase